MTFMIVAMTCSIILMALGKAIGSVSRELSGIPEREINYL